MELGNIAEWVGAVGTVGALFLAIVLFARERAVGRRKSVDGLISWLTWREVPDRDRGVRIDPDARGGYGSEIVSDDGRPTMLPPGAEIHRVIQGAPRNTVARYLWMTSEDGRVWIRRVDAHRYVNSFGHLLLTLLLLAFERKDGSSTRRRHQRAGEFESASRNASAPSASLQ